MPSDVDLDFGTWSKARLFVIVVLDIAVAFLSVVVGSQGHPEYSIALVVLIVGATFGLIFEEAWRSGNTERALLAVYSATAKNRSWSDIIIDCGSDKGRNKLLTLFETIKTDHQGTARCFLTWSGDYQEMTKYEQYFRVESKFLLERANDPARRVTVRRLISVGPSLVKDADFQLHRQIMNKAALKNEVYDYALTANPTHFDYAYSLEMIQNIAVHKAVVVFLDSQRKPSQLALYFDGSTSNESNYVAKEIGEFLGNEFDRLVETAH